MDVQYCTSTNPQLFGTQFDLELYYVKLPAYHSAL